MTQLQLKLIKFNTSEKVVYDNGTDTQTPPETKPNETSESTNTNGGDQSNANSNSSGDSGGSGDKSFTQAELNAIIASERRVYEQKSSEMLNKLQALEQSAGLTVQQKEQLQEQIKVLEDQSRSKEDLEKERLEKERKKYEENLNQVEQKATFWETELKNQKKQNAILGESMKAKAINPEIVSQLILPDCQVLEEKEGDEIKSFSVRFVKDVIDKDGNPKTLNLSPEDAITWFKEQEGNAHLFEGSQRTGYGGGSNVSGGRKIAASDIKNLEDLKKFKAQEGMT